jgi:phosphatidylglycerol:prolipoprotein diacylglycerol transferase
MSGKLYHSGDTPEDRAAACREGGLDEPVPWAIIPGIRHGEEMIPFPEIRPYILKVGPLQLRWYGLMYLFGFAGSWLLVRRAVRERAIALTAEDIGTLYTWCIVGLLAGARLGYVVFYNLSYYLDHPLAVAAVWEGGMSFHGGLIGSVFAGYLFARRSGMRRFLLADLVMATAPVGLFFGRLGNFINGELFGRRTDVPWAMVFPLGGEGPRHPSQLYEAFCEGIVLLAILQIVGRTTRREGTVTALFLVLYGALRFLIEFTREPDSHLGFVAGPLTMGQLLCLVMIAAGLVLMRLRPPVPEDFNGGLRAGYG